MKAKRTQYLLVAALAGPLTIATPLFEQDVATDDKADAVGRLREGGRRGCQKNRR